MTSFKATWQQIPEGDGNARIKMGTTPDGSLTGEVEFYASVHGNVDLVGDRVMKGAFDSSLTKWRDSGNPIPIVWSHDWGNAKSIIGWADPNDCYEDDFGLLIKGKLDVDINPDAKLIAWHMHRKIVREASFAFDVPRGGEGRAKDGANNLNQLDIIEVGPCLKGANPLAGHPTVKGLLGVGAKQILEGSREEISAAIQFAASEKFGSKDIAIFVEGTYDDHAVLCSLKMDSDEPKYHSVEYTIEGDTVTFGKSVEVELEPTKSVEPDDEKKKDADAADATSEANSGDRETRGEVTAGSEVVKPDKKDDIIPPPTAKSEGSGNIHTVDIELRFVDGEGNPLFGEKAGARNSRADQAALQAAHDAAVKAGAMCYEPDDDQMVKAADVDVYAKMQERIEFFREMGDVAGELQAIEALVKMRAKSTDSDELGEDEADDDQEDADEPDEKALGDDEADDHQKEMMADCGEDCCMKEENCDCADCKRCEEDDAEDAGDLGVETKDAPEDGVEEKSVDAPDGDESTAKDEEPDTAKSEEPAGYTREAAAADIAEIERSLGL